jgi:uncharacterized phage protein (TIGR02220 family)
MAKRFTDSRKYRDPWFRKLSPIQKCVWDYMIHECNHAGIWEVDFELASFCIGTAIDEESIDWLKGRIYAISDEKWFIPNFIEFQYGELNQENRVHKSVIDLLKKEGAYKVLISPLQGCKDKDKDKNKDKDKDKNKNKKIIKEIVSDLNTILKTSYKFTTSKTQEKINARLNEGFTVDDFKTVHRKMLRAWGADEKMVKYLRPETLYSPKFESYLNMKEPTTKLTDAGMKTYLIGQEWIRKAEENEKR